MPKPQRAHKTATVRHVRVFETFVSLSGEASRQGYPSSFIRLAGCPLHCAYCDTKTTWAVDSGSERTVDELVTWCVTQGIPLVTVTGGEPLIQAETPALLRALCEHGFTVQLETSGCYPIDAVDERVAIVLDIKTPSSGCADRTVWSNIARLQQKDEVKFVLSQRADYEWARTLLDVHDLVARCGCVLFSAVWGTLDARLLTSWVIADKLRVRVQLQLHKIIAIP